MRKSAPLFCALLLSLSARRAWIEIIKKGRARRPGQVALRKESVDRNNRRLATVHNAEIVALRKESVDRNHAMQIVVIVMDTSLSARRAWIEMTQGVFNLFSNPGSLSARRAWIEMPHRTHRRGLFPVALRKESVDRNFYYSDKDADWVRRSPQGERG